VNRRVGLPGLPGLALWVAGCGGPELPPEPPVDPVSARAEAEALARTVAPPAVAPVATTPGEPAELVFSWHEVGPLYQGFFLDQVAVTQLATDWSGRLAGRANVHVYWDEANDIGRIRLQLLPGTLTNPVGGEGEVLRLQDLAPLTEPLARYRERLAGQFDVRIASFRVELESVRGARLCVVSIIGGHPPDGRVISPCVEFNGQEVCGRPEAAGVRFTADQAEDLRACLDPRG